MAGPLSDDSLLRLIRHSGVARLGTRVLHVARPLEASGNGRRDGTRGGDRRDYLAARPFPASRPACAPAVPPPTGETIWPAASTRPSPRRSSTPGRASATRARTTRCWSRNWPTSGDSPTWRSRWTSPSTPTAPCALGWRPSSKPSSSTTTYCAGDGERSSRDDRGPDRDCPAGIPCGAAPVPLSALTADQPDDDLFEEED